MPRIFDFPTDKLTILECTLKINISLDDVNEIKPYISELYKSVKEDMYGLEFTIQKMLLCILLNKHAILESLPGLAKSTLVERFRIHVGLNSTRIQFIPDMQPGDLLGKFKLVTINSNSDLQWQKGPLFSNIVLADEINRAASRVQSVMLEAMAERKITLLNEGEKKIISLEDEILLRYLFAPNSISERQYKKIVDAIRQYKKIIDAILLGNSPPQNIGTLTQLFVKIFGYFDKTSPSFKSDCQLLKTIFNKVPQNIGALTQLLVKISGYSDKESPPFKNDCQILKTIFDTFKDLRNEFTKTEQDFCSVLSDALPIDSAEYWNCRKSVFDVEDKHLTQFTVFGTMNPLEGHGTYPLSEAQVDRFDFKILLKYPSKIDLSKIADLSSEPKYQLDEESLQKIEETVPDNIYNKLKKYDEKLTSDGLLEVLYKVLEKNEVKIWKESIMLCAKKLGQDVSFQQHLSALHLLRLIREKIIANDGLFLYEPNVKERINCLVYFSSWKKTDDTKATRPPVLDEIAAEISKEKIFDPMMTRKEFKYVDVGGSPRAALALQPAVRAWALLQYCLEENNAKRADLLSTDLDDVSKIKVTWKHVKALAKDVLRHRITLNYMAKLENVIPDDVIDALLDILDPNP